MIRYVAGLGALAGLTLTLYGIMPYRPRLSVGERVLIFGDSQAGGLGRGMAQAIAQSGRTVDVSSHTGDTTRELAAKFAEYPRVGSYDVVVLFAGGNDGDRDYSADFRGMVERALAVGAKVVALGPLPVTEIGDMSRARAVWGPGVEQPSHFFDTGYARDMAAVRGRFRRSLAGLRDVRYFDVGEVFSDAQMRYGLAPDGVHGTLQHGLDMAPVLFDLRRPRA